MENMENGKVKAWADLYPGEKEQWLTKAEWLIERGYLSNDVYKVAEIMYNKHYGR
tara:strand:- start:3461 stop:3625 length:165 start_codon:yes stop_codon:yes gene_type:complete